MARFIEDGEKTVAYDSILIPPNKLRILGSELSMKIVRELARSPGCAMDLSRKLEQHEQKIYYHLRNLEGAGIIKQTRTEQRYGMTAKIYDVVSPVVATKLYNDGFEMKEEACQKNPKIEKFLHPFVKDGKLNALVIMGDAYAHGRFNGIATEGSHIFDFALMLGTFLGGMERSSYKLDTEVKESDLKNNLILIGNPRTNMVIDRINSGMPAYFDEKNDFAIMSKESGKVYTNSRDAVILKMKNPFKKDKKILLLGGTTRERGTRAAIKAFMKYAKDMSRNSRRDDTVLIVRGMDKDGDKIIDDAEILERW